MANQLNHSNLNSAAFQKLMQDTAEPSNDPKCTKILPATSAAPKYKFVMPTEFVMKHMSHLIEKQLQLVDDSERSFTITLIQRRNKDKYEYMLSGWRKYGDVNQIKEGDTVLFEMLNPGVLKVSVISHGAAPPRERPGKLPKRKRASTDTDDDDDYDDSLPPYPQQHSMGGAQQHSQLTASRNQQSQLSPGNFAAAAAQQQQQQQHQGGGRGGHSPSHGRSGQQISPFENAQGQQPASPLYDAPPQLAPLLHQRQGTNTADQLAAALTAVQQLELPPAELLALMHANSLPDLAPLPSTDLLALMQQQMMQQAGSGGQGGQGGHDGGGGPGGGGPGGGGPGKGLLPPGMAPLVPGLSPLQPTVAELAAVVNQLEKQARGDGALQQPDNAPAWEVLLQENVQLREELQQWKAKVAGLQGTLQSVGRAISQKTDPGLVAMTGVFNAMNQIEAPDFLPDMPARTRAVVQEVLAELRQQLNAVLQMVWEVRQLSEMLGKELGQGEDQQRGPKQRMPNGM